VQEQKQEPVLVQVQRSVVVSVASVLLLEVVLVVVEVALLVAVLVVVAVWASAQECSQRCQRYRSLVCGEGVQRLVNVRWLQRAYRWHGTYLGASRC